MLKVDFMKSLIQKLGKQGWKRRQGDHNPLSNPIILRNKQHSIIVSTSIPVDPEKKLQDEIDDYFKRVMDKVINEGPISMIYLPGGGSIPIPKFFIEFCKERKIEIRIINSENYNDISVIRL